MEWNYNDSYKRYPIKKEKIYQTINGKLAVHDIKNDLPEFMFSADVIICDPPWNLGNLKTFYTKADLDFKNFLSFEEFYKRIFYLISKINPKYCFLEIGKEYLADFIFEMKKIYKYVTFYNSTYYHNKNNFCYFVQGSMKKENLHLDNIDEEEIIYKIPTLINGEIFGDFCIGRGLVALSATKANKKFVGIELNHKRLSVCFERLEKLNKKNSKI